MDNILHLIKRIKEKRTKCPKCGGTGKKFKVRPAPKGTMGNYSINICDLCKGSGKRN